MIPVVRKMVKDLFREKTFVFALLLQLLLILSIYVVLGFTSLFFAPESLLTEKVDIGVIGKDNFFPYLNASRYANVVVFEDPHEAIVSFETGAIDAVVVQNSRELPMNYTIYVPESEIQSTIILALLKDRFESYEDALRQEEIDSSAIPLSQIRFIGSQRKGADYNFELLYGLLIPFLLLVPVFLIGSLVIDNMCEEIERKTINLLLIATSFKRVFLEVVVGSLMLLLLQLFVWIAFLQARGITIFNVEEILVYTGLFSVLVFLAGILLSVTLKTKTKSQLMYSLFVMGVSVTAGATQYNPINVISRMSLDIEQTGVIPYLVLIIPVILLYFILAQKRVTEDIV